MTIQTACFDEAIPVFRVGDRVRTKHGLATVTKRTHCPTTGLPLRRNDQGPMVLDPQTVHLSGFAQVRVKTDRRVLCHWGCSDCQCTETVVVDVWYVTRLAPSS